MEILISRKIILALIVLAAISFYITFIFNSCVVSSISKAIPKWRIHPVVPNEVPVVHYSTSVRVVSLLEGNETDISPKYRFFREQGLRPERQLPSALIIGVKKGGTRALLEFIRIHPDVRAAGNEVHFFDKNYIKGFQWYRNRMPATLEGQLTIEKTPSYFITKEAPRRVQLMNPSTKLLVVVRDPVTRAISDYAQAISKKYDMKPFEQLVFVNGSIGSIIDTSWGPIKLGIYSRYLARWLKFFPLSQLLFVSGERLVLDPAIELKRVQDFLGLKRVVTEKHFYFNSTKGFPCLFKSEGHSSPHCLESPKEVPTPVGKPKKPKIFKTYKDELTTLPNANVTVTPAGSVFVERIKDDNENVKSLSTLESNKEKNLSKKPKKSKSTENIQEEKLKQQKNRNPQKKSKKKGKLQQQKR